MSRIGNSALAVVALAVAGVGLRAATVAPLDPQGGWHLSEPYSVEVELSGDALRVSGGAFVVTRSYDGPEPCYAPGPGYVRDEQMWLMWAPEGGTAADAYDAIRAWAQAPAGSRVRVVVSAAGVRVDSDAGPRLLTDEDAAPPAVLDEIKAALYAALLEQAEGV